MDASLVLWIYIVLLVVGGVIGFVKAGSKASLIMSVVFAAILVVLNIRPVPVGPIGLADVVLLVLLVFFGVRLAKSKKFMPAGLMTILTILALALRHVPW